MDIYTKNPKINTLNKIEVDSGGRETAACRWEKYKEATQRTALYHVSAPNITPEDSLLILELERVLRSIQNGKQAPLTTYNIKYCKTISRQNIF